jgi:hypothetical protein
MKKAWRVKTLHAADLAEASGCEGAAEGLVLILGGFVLHVDVAGGTAVAVAVVVFAALNIAAHALDAAAGIFNVAHVFFLR